jgi:hypothetical protein
MNNELKRILEKCGDGLIKILSQHVLEGIGENHEKHKVG